MEVMKQLRQRAIRDLVEQRPIRTQQELAAALRERGFRTTQATISRDVAELGLVKAGRDGMQAYAIPPRLREADTSGEERMRRLLHDMPVEIREAGTMLVLRTLPGSAHPLAAALDRARWPEVVGLHRRRRHRVRGVRGPRVAGPRAPPPGAAGRGRRVEGSGPGRPRRESGGRAAASSGPARPSEELRSGRPSRGGSGAGRPSGGRRPRAAERGLRPRAAE